MLYCNGIRQKDYFKNGRRYKNEKLEVAWLN